MVWFHQCLETSFWPDAGGCSSFFHSGLSAAVDKTALNVCLQIPSILNNFLVLKNGNKQKKLFIILKAAPESRNQAGDEAGFQEALRRFQALNCHWLSLDMGGLVPTAALKHRTVELCEKWQLQTEQDTSLGGPQAWRVVFSPAVRKVRAQEGCRALSGV